MLRIERLRVEINTINGLYGVDQSFQKGLNFVASEDNTCGKSSILAAIYYCLGLEQILGGVAGIGSKVLTSAFKTSIEDNGEKYNVTESGAYLEISDGFETVTVYRNIKNEYKNNRLVTVFHGSIDSLSNPNIESSDYYVNISHSATSEQGFHTFLEQFMHLELPLVRGSDGSDRKLYLQIIFSAMLIEQKHGWSGILSGMPVFGIRESKKRTVEYILGLDTFKNEKLRDILNDEKVSIERNWSELVNRFTDTALGKSCRIINLPLLPRVLSDCELSRVGLTTESKHTLSEECESLHREYDLLAQRKPRATDNFEELNKELSATEAAIAGLENELTDFIHKRLAVKQTVRRLESDIKEIMADIRNNEDAARLQKFGSESAGEEISVNICPTCKQPIQDSLIDANPCAGFMNIEENLHHLRAQKKLLEFSLNSRKSLYKELSANKTICEKQIITLRRLALALRTDLNTATDTDASEAIILKKLEISKRIEEIEELQTQFNDFISSLKGLSERWNEYLHKKRMLPSKGLSDSDKEKIKCLRKYFIKNLQRYHYSSLMSLEEIDIPFETLMPTIDGFDMKFDSSASDGIRMIWAFTLSLLQVSLEKNGNHFGIIIFDEPAQQSIVPEDMRSFIHSVAEIETDSQIIMGITLNSQELVDIIDALDSEKYHKITIKQKAFRKLVPDGNEK